MTRDIDRLLAAAARPETTRLKSETAIPREASPFDVGTADPLVGPDQHAHTVSKTKYLVQHCADGSVRFCRNDETLDLAQRIGGLPPRFWFLDHRELEEIVGHAVPINTSDVPLLSERDRQAVGVALHMRQAIKDSADLPAEERQSALLRELRSQPDPSVARRVVDAGQRAMQRERRRLRDQINVLGVEGEKLDARRRELEALAAWCSGPLTLQRAEGSQMHKLGQALQSDEALVLVGLAQSSGKLKPIGREMMVDMLEDLKSGSTHSYVVEHDWAAAFGAASVTGEGSGEVRPHAERCCFEFQISGRRVLALYGVNVISDGGPGVAISVRLTDGTWAVCGVYRVAADWSVSNVSLDFAREMSPLVSEKAGLMLRRLGPLAQLVAAQIRAVFVMLEAGVATHEVVRAPAKLNRRRKAAGKLPIRDYHVVSLARRTRALPRGEPLDPDRPIVRRRLHFRRGHWRRYSDHRTWIRWCLAGDPDLGFVDKEYRL